MSACVSNQRASPHDGSLYQYCWLTTWAHLLLLPSCRLPFDARSMNELKNKVILARFPPVTPGAPYSPALVNICHALLNR